MTDLSIIIVAGAIALCVICLLLLQVAEYKHKERMAQIERGQTPSWND